MDSMLFNFLDVLLFRFSTDHFVCKQISITQFDRVSFQMRAVGFVDPNRSSGG